MKKWQPHIKTTKIPEIWSMLVKYGVTRFKCATVREAEFLLKAAGKTSVELLCAMSLYGQNLKDFNALSLKNKQHKLSVLTENP